MLRSRTGAQGNEAAVILRGEGRVKGEASVTPYVSRIGAGLREDEAL